jgi:hypothetical protein
MTDEPDAELAEREPVTHRQRTGAHEALPAAAQPEALDGTAGGIGPVENPDGLAVPGGGFEHVQQGGDERVDAATEILQVDQQYVEMREHLLGGPAHLPVETEHGNAMNRVAEIRRLDHVVLFVAAQAVLRTECGGDVQPADRAQRIERMLEVGGHGSRVREQRHAAPLEFLQQLVVAEQAIDAELDQGRPFNRAR